jgi:uncharacterized protein YcaQ
MDTHLLRDWPGLIFFLKNIDSIVKLVGVGYNSFRCSGRGAARLARLHGVQEVGGSNPLAPTTVTQDRKRATCLFFIHRSEVYLTGTTQLLSPPTTVTRDRKRATCLFFYSQVGGLPYRYYAAPLAPTTVTRDRKRATCLFFIHRSEVYLTGTTQLLAPRLQ